MLEEPPDDLLIIAEPTGKQTETRVKDAESARSLLRSLIYEDQARSQRRTLVRGLVDGNPPYDNAKQRNAGLAWQANLNLMEGKALMDSSGIPYYSLFTGAEPFVEASTEFEPDNPDNGWWCGQIAMAFHRMLKRWPQFDWHMQQATYWMRMHGIGPCLHEEDDNWRFRAVESGVALVPKNTPSCIDHRVPYVMVRVKYRAHELYGFIRDEEAAKEQGWDVEAVKVALQNSYHGGDDGMYGATNWEDIQRALKNDDLTTAFTRCDEISVAHLYANEYSGKVSHFILTENPLRQDNFDPSDWGKRFLYKHAGRYDKLEEVLTVFFQDIGDGTWHSVRGLADLAFKHLEVLNRLDCRMIDGAFIDSGIVLQPEGQRDMDKIQSIQWGPFTVLPAGLKMQNARVSGQLEGTMAVSRAVRNGLANNVGMFNQRSVAREDGRGEAVTATQIRAQVTKEAHLNQGQMAIAYLTCDSLYNQMFRRAKNRSTMDEEALRFQMDVQLDGVPPEALDMARVRANRAAGFGSPQMAFQVLNELMPIVPMLPEDGKKTYVDMFIQATVGAEKVRILNPEHHVASDDDWAAAQENLMFDSGRTPVLASGQNDVVHLRIHLADAGRKLGPVQQAMTMGEAGIEQLQGALMYIGALTAHLEEHLARLEKDPASKQLAPEFNEALKQLSQMASDMEAAIEDIQREQEEAAQAEAKASALDAETEAKVRASDADIVMSAQKTQSKIQNDRAKVANKAKLDQLKTAQELNLSRLKASAEVEKMNSSMNGQSE
jgi:hypothetical protein